MKQRTITAIFIVLVCIPFVIFGDWLFTLGVGVVSIFAFKEILDLKKSHIKYPFMIKLLAMLGLLSVLFTNMDPNLLEYGFKYQSAIIPLVLLLLPTLFYKEEDYTTKDAFYLLGCILLLGLAFNMFILTRAQGIYTFLYLLLISTLNDVFALIFGLLIGRHKLCPSVSPKKTIEGSLGGLLVGSVIPVVFYGIFVGDITLKLIVCTIILGITGQVGDLFFSKIKRENGIKDYSNLMPGHGGILDRLDSLVFVVLAFILVLGII
jgi:phosphatidate cytidylyltransferase